MTRRFAILAATAALLGAVPVHAQLIRQTVQGVWRQCIYVSRTQIGSANPRRRLGAPVERVFQVGRGEPCPASYPVQPPRRRPPPPVSTWSSEPTPDPR